MKKLSLILIFLSIAAVLLPMIKPFSTQAAGASLYLSPTSGTKYVGDKFNMFVYVGASQAVNTFDVYLSTNSNLTVTGVSSGGSICVLFPNPPSYTGSTARFKCGLPTPGFNGGKGYIGSVTVQANSVGTGRVSIDSPSSVLANDGAGTNVLGSKGSANFNIQPRPTAAPTISSPTHPDQDKWYKATSAKFEWASGAGNFSYTLDHDTDTVPDKNSEGSAKSKTFENLSEGVWYFHITALGGNGAWSSPGHFRIQIDTSPPEKFTPEADPKNNADKRPIIAFVTTDKISGIDHYELKVGDGSWAKVDNPYKLPSISSGKHTIFVKAIDKAGNETIGKVDITVKEIPTPKITKPSNNSTLPYSNTLYIEGTAQAGYSVKIFLNGKLIATVKADKSGKFNYNYKELLRAGKHELYAVAVNEDSIESAKSNLVKFTIDPQAYRLFGFTFPSWTLFGSSIFLLILMAILLFLLLFGAKRFRRKLKKVLEDLEKEVDQDLEKGKVDKKTRQEIDDDFDSAEEKV